MGILTQTLITSNVVSFWLEPINFLSDSAAFPSAFEASLPLIDSILSMAKRISNITTVSSGDTGEPP